MEHSQIREVGAKEVGEPDGQDWDNPPTLERVAKDLVRLETRIDELFRMLTNDGGVPRSGEYQVTIRQLEDQLRGRDATIQTLCEAGDQMEGLISQYRQTMAIFFKYLRVRLSCDHPHGAYFLEIRNEDGQTVQEVPVPLELGKAGEVLVMQDSAYLANCPDPSEKANVLVCGSKSLEQNKQLGKIERKK